MKDKDREEERDRLAEQARKADQAARDAAVKLEDAEGKIVTLEAQVREKEIKISELERAKRDEKEKTAKAAEDLEQYKLVAEREKHSADLAHKRQLSEAHLERDSHQVCSKSSDLGQLG